MATLSPMLREFAGAKKRDYCDCEIAELNAVSSVASQSISERAGMLKPFRRDFYHSLEKQGWQLGFRFGDFPRMGRIQAAVTIDAVKTLDCSDCAHRHRLLIEMCTDNRQAILANLLKLEFAGRKFVERYPTAVPCGLGIFVTQGRKPALVAKGCVDGSIGTLEEYEIQATGPWEGLLTNSLIALTL